MLTNKFPFLLPLRLAQRKAFFYTSMRFDGNTYARTLQDELLPYELFSADSGLYNADTGFDMIYQENKVFNLKLAAKTLNGLLIKPGETFSLWRLLRKADKHTPYKDGLVVKNGKLCVSNGGGLCQISNLLFWVFLHSSLSIVERHTHKVKDFPTLRNAEPEGVDATISEGWLDLKVRNDTNMTFQVIIRFDNENIIGSILCDSALPFTYKIDGENLTYYWKDGAIYEKISIYRCEVSSDTDEPFSKTFLYENVCRIGYQLPENTVIRMGEDLLQ